MEQYREIRVSGEEYAPCLRELAENSGSRQIDGRAVVFGRESRVIHDHLGKYVEIIEQGAITPELLARSDVKMTLWHNRERLLARSNKGVGSLSTGVDEKGVWYRFDAPNTPDGNTALELVRRGDLTGSSFKYYSKPENVRWSKREDGTIIRRVLKVDYIGEMTIASDEAYRDTVVNAREVLDMVEPKPQPNNEWRGQVRALRRKTNIF